MSKKTQKNRPRLKRRPTRSISTVESSNKDLPYLCILCGFIYPGKDWHKLPADWRCPDCGTTKKNFDPARLNLGQ